MVPRPSPPGTRTPATGRGCHDAERRERLRNGRSRRLGLRHRLSRLARGRSVFVLRLRQARRADCSPCSTFPRCTLRELGASSARTLRDPTSRGCALQPARRPSHGPRYGCRGSASGRRGAAPPPAPQLWPRCHGRTAGRTSGFALSRPSACSVCVSGATRSKTCASASAAHPQASRTFPLRPAAQQLPNPPHRTAPARGTRGCVCRRP